MQRHTKTNKCKICDGYETAERGVGKRCYGFASPDGQYVNCTRPEFAGQLELNTSSKAYVHRLVGDCNCGRRHDPSPARKIVATYDYKDETGRLLYQVVRYEPKHFLQRKPDGDGWNWKLGDVQRVLYQLPSLTNDLRRDDTVYIVEGEKDADLLFSYGLLATTNAGGAGKWRSEYTEVLRGRNVVIIPDHDEAGLEHANKVVNALVGVAASVRLVTPGDKKDVSEWFAAGGSVDELKQIIDTVAPSQAAPADQTETTTPAENAPTAEQDERTLLGTVINTPDILPHLAAELKGWHIGNVQYQIIYKAMLAIDERGETVDVPTLFNELRTNPSLGGFTITRDELNALTVNIPSLAEHTIQQSLKRVRNAAHLRYMLKLHREVERRILSGEHSASDIYNYQNDSLDKLSIVTGVSQDFVSFEQMASEMAVLYQALHEGKVVAVSTGFRELDNILAWGGLIPKTTTVLAAHTSFGKTAFALDLAKRIAVQGYEVAIFSLEMGRESLFMRVHSNVSDLPSHKIRPYMSDKERDLLLKTLDEMRGLPIYINDRISDLLLMRAAVRTFMRTHKNVGAIIIDYLQLANISTLRHDAQERERISELSKLFKQLAMEFNVAIVILSQFSRDSFCKDKEEGNCREPQLSDLYGSSSLEKDADNVWFLHGEKPDEIVTVRELEFIFKKQRMGRLGRFNLTFDTSRNRFTERAAPFATSSTPVQLPPPTVHAPVAFDDESPLF